MATKKYYGVKVGRISGVYTTWAECQKQVAGYKGALFKGFLAKREAEDYVYGTDAASGAENTAAAPVSEKGGKHGKHYDIYVDGSYSDSLKQYGWAFAVYDGPELFYTDSGTGNNPEALESRNVAGELQATVEAVKWAQEQGIDAITIHHDYIGISEWVTGGWKTNKKLTRDYAQFMSAHLKRVRFNKVSGHSGVKGNELADKLAGEALKIK